MGDSIEKINGGKGKVQTNNREVEEWSLSIEITKKFLKKFTFV